MAVLLPGELRDLALAASENAGSATGFYFFTPEQERTCAAICSRVVPSTDPVSGGFAPGATEARAVVFIDRLLAAFSLPDSVADNPAIYLKGPYSNRNPYPDYSTGEPGSTYPADSFMSAARQVHYLPLDDLQQLSWRALIEGVDAALASAPPWVSSKWADQVRSGFVPAPGPVEGLQKVYRAGLAAFDSYSKSTFGVPFWKATPQQQDLMLEAAGNAVVSQLPLPAPPAAPPDAKTLFPYVVAHTFEGSYGLPEYRGMDANPLWPRIHWDGDTQPLGSSIYDSSLHGPGQGPNEGFGEQGVYVPEGDYKEYRPVSYLGSGSSTPLLGRADIAALVDALEKAGIMRPLGGDR